MQMQKVLKNNVIFVKTNKIKENKQFFEKDLMNKLKIAEKQIENGEVVSSDIVFNELRQKYEY